MRALPFALALLVASAATGQPLAPAEAEGVGSLTESEVCAGPCASPTADVSVRRLLDPVARLSAPPSKPVPKERRGHNEASDDRPMPRIGLALVFTGEDSGARSSQPDLGLPPLGLGISISTTDVRDGAPVQPVSVPVGARLPVTETVSLELAAPARWLIPEVPRLPGTPTLSPEPRSSTMDDILRPAIWLGTRAAVVGFACGVVYSVGGLVVDAVTTGLNNGTVLAFGALVGMPVLLGAAGFVAGALGGAAVVGVRVVLGD